LSQGLGETMPIAQEKAVAAAKEIFERSFTVCKIYRSISSSMYALQYAVKLTDSEICGFSPIVSLQDAPIIKITEMPFIHIIDNSTNPDSKKPNVSDTYATSEASQKQYSVPAISEFEKQPNKAEFRNSVTESGELSNSVTKNGNFMEDFNLKNILMIQLKDDFSNFVVVANSNINKPDKILSSSLTANKVQFSYKYEITSMHVCYIVIKGIKVVTEMAISKRAAKIAAATKLLQHLVAYFPCMIKSKLSAKALKRQENKLKKKEKQATKRESKLLKEKDKQDEPIDENNIGNQILRKMGWSGSGGLGKRNDGIVEPVKIFGKRGQCFKGLGHESFHAEMFSVKTAGGSVKDSNERAENHIALNNIGNRFLKKMGWSRISGYKKLSVITVGPTQSSEELSECVDDSGHKNPEKFRRYRGWWIDSHINPKKFGECDQKNDVADQTNDDKLDKCVDGLVQKNYSDETKPTSSAKHGFANAKKLIHDYIACGCNGKLTFSPDLSSEERKELHLFASGLGLKSKSLGKGANRYIILSKNYSLQDTYQELLLTGGNVNGYILPS